MTLDGAVLSELRKYIFIVGLEKGNETRFPGFTLLQPKAPLILTLLTIYMQESLHAFSAKPFKLAKAMLVCYSF